MAASVIVLPVFLLIMALIVALPIMIGVFVYRDATRRGMSGVLWTLIAILAPGFIGLIIYLIVRSEHSAINCPNCGQAVQERYAMCPHCGYALKEKCLSCGKPIDSGWMVCPECGAEISEYQKEKMRMNAEKSGKDKGLGKILAIVFIIPLALCVVLFVGIVMFSVAGSGTYFSGVDNVIENYSDEVADWTKECDAKGKGVYVIADSVDMGHEVETSYLIYRNDGNYWHDTNQEPGGWFKAPEVTVNFNGYDESEDTKGYTLVHLDYISGNKKDVKLRILTEGSETEYIVSDGVSLFAEDLYAPELLVDIEVDDRLSEVYTLDVAVYYEDGSVSSSGVECADGTTFAGESANFNFPNAPSRIMNFVVTAFDQNGNELFVSEQNDVVIEFEDAEYFMKLVKTSDGYKLIQ